MATYKLKRKVFTRYDETDALKRMKDSDILAEQKKSSPSLMGPATQAVSGAATGAGVGALALGAKGLGNAGSRWSSALKGVKKGGIAGAIIGGTIAGSMALSKRNKEANDTDFYNKRLDYAQRQARRREKADWNSNMTQREGYSY